MCIDNMHIDIALSLRHTYVGPRKEELMIYNVGKRPNKRKELATKWFPRMRAACRTGADTRSVEEIKISNNRPLYPGSTWAAHTNPND